MMTLAEEQARSKKKLEKESKILALDRAINCYGRNAYVAGTEKVSTPEKIIEAARKFYDYIEGK